MLTHPDTAERRAEQEKRPPGAIADEVNASVKQLLTLGIQKEQDQILSWCSNGLWDCNIKSNATESVSV